MAPTQITDHVARASSRVVTHLRGTEFELLVRAVAGEVQVLEDALASLIKPLRDRDDASGITLDKLAALVGAETRRSNIANTSSMPDASYRLRVQAAIERNVSWCRIENVHTAVLAFFPWLIDPTYTLTGADVEGAGCFRVNPNSYSVDQYVTIAPREAEEFMRYLAIPAGVRGIFTYSAVAQDGDGTLAVFDSVFNGFESGAAFVGSVDQNTRN